MTDEAEADRRQAVRHRIRRILALEGVGFALLLAIAAIVGVATGSAGWAFAMVFLLSAAVMVVWLAVTIARPDIRRPVFRIYAQVFRNRYGKSN